MRRIEEPCFLEPADRALVGIRRENLCTEPRLVDAHASLAYGVAALDWINREQWLALVKRPHHAPRSERDSPAAWVVSGHKDRPFGPIPARPSADEVRERDLQFEGRA